MRRPYARLAAACALAAATALFTSTALADPGNGNSANAPGQVKQEQAAQPQAAQPTAQQPEPEQQAEQQSAAQTQAPGQVKKAAVQAQVEAQAQVTSHGQAKKAAATSSSASTSSSAGASAGVKPANNTTHWTHCTTGGSSAGATCGSSDSGHTPQVKADVSKSYGNGKTAAQIAVSRGGVGVQLTGPGNSQPHKTYDCAHKKNPSGGVDVHAIKSYSATCASVQVQAAPLAPVCGYSVVTQTTLAGKANGHGKGLVHNKHMTASTTSSLQANGQSCGVGQPGTQQQTQQVQASQQTQVQASQQQTQQTQVQASQQQTQQTQGQASQSATHRSSTAAAAPNNGVLGAQATLTKPKHASHGGVLGTVAHVSGNSLPFTGFPVWVAILIALALIAGGLLVRRRIVA